jgi:hypothetical protein
MREVEGSGDWMQTYTGRQFWPLDPRPEDVCAEDIAHGLSHQCRYAGHTRFFYSTAEHCCLMHDAAGEHRREMLLHDCAETWMSDVVRPVKKQLSDFAEIEAGIERVVAAKYGLAYPWPDLVREYDTRILLDERAALMARPPAPWAMEDLEPLGVEIRCWSPAVAKAQFLARFMGSR